MYDRNRRSKSRNRHPHVDPMLRSWSALRTSLPRAVPTVMARGMAGAPRAVRPHRAWPQWSSPPPQHEYWQPNSWLGAYYKLREGQPVAEANKARLVGKKTPKRGNFIVGAMEAVEMRKLQAAQPWRSMAGWKPGTYLEVDHTPRTGEALERVVGILLGCKRKGLGSSFRLLCNADSTAVEYQFQTFSPLVRAALHAKHARARACARLTRAPCVCSSRAAARRRRAAGVAVARRQAYDHAAASRGAQAQLS